MDEILLFELLYDIRRKVRRIEHKLKHIEARLMPTVDDIRAQLDATFQKVSGIDDFETSVEVAFQGIKDANTALSAQVTDLQNQINSGAQPDLTPLTDSIATINSKLDDVQTRQAVLAGTDAGGGGDQPVDNSGGDQPVDTGGDAPDNGDQPAASARRSAAKRR